MKIISRGFSLIEILIVLAIVGILSSIALPAYTEHIARGLRADAKAQLQQAAQYMQRFQAANDSFMTDRGGNHVKDVLPAQLKQSPAQGTAVYTIEFGSGKSVVSDTEFTLVMTPVAGGRMATDKCGALTLDSYGRRGVTADAALRDGCWR